MSQQLLLAPAILRTGSPSWLMVEAVLVGKFAVHLGGRRFQFRACGVAWTRDSFAVRGSPNFAQ